MGGSAESIVPSEGVGYDRQGDRSRVPTGFKDPLEEAIPLLAEALRAARVGLGISSTLAAQRVGLDPVEYRALEGGRVAKNKENAALMVSAARRMGLEDLRIVYAGDVQQYIKVDLSTDGPLVIFVDKLSFDVRDLKEQAVFVNPSKVLTLVHRLGFDKTLASRQPAYKQLIELWTAAVFTLCLRRDRDYYVRLVRDDPPDTEVLEINGPGWTLREIGIEITQHGSHSKDMVNVIEKKLRKKYQEGTVLVVLVEQAENILVNSLDDFIRANNPHNQRVFIIGGSEALNTFKVVPLDKISKPTTSETEWLEIVVNAKGASKGYSGYEGVVFGPQRSWFLPQHPVFVKELEIRR